MRLKYPVVLASASPRRVDLLSQIVDEFTVDPAHIDEDALTVEDPFLTAKSLAREKAFAVFERHPDSIVIGGDTVVAIETPEGWKQFGKPKDAAHAVEILTELQGRTHVVITGIAIRHPKGLIVFADENKVTFSPLSQEDIEAYVATGDPLDKAGAYGIQGMAGGFLHRLEGSIESVMGLPVEALSQALKDAH